MDWKTLLPIIESAAIVLLGFVVSYLKTSSVVREFIAELIDDAEEEFKDKVKAGTEKMEYVVNLLYDYIPAVFKPIITKDRLKVLAQKVFDSIQSYADKQVAKLKAKYDAKKKK